MANGDTKTNQYLDIAANGTRADLPSDTCCETRTQTLIRGVAERIMDVEDELERLENNPDVADIVATYADLQAYDTSQLTDKDIIRVLQDETRDGDSTYYRWSTATNTWTYIGESKQYTDFVGTDGTTAGEAGLVPAPATTDAGKFLKADGTWDTAGSNINIVQTTGTSTTDVMSQDATTKMIYKNSKNQIVIGDGATAASSGTQTQVIIGSGAHTTSPAIGGVALGPYAKSSSQGAIAIGGESSNTHPTASGTRGVSVGAWSTASGDYSIALGAGSTANSKGQMDISTGSSGLNGYNNSNYRLLTGLYDPQDAHDAATKGYVDTAVAGAGGGEPDYSTSEVDTGTKWVDGKTIYKKTVAIPSLSSDTIFINLRIANLYRVVEVKGFLYNPHDQTGGAPLVSASTGDASNQIGVSISSGTLNVYSSGRRDWTGYATIYYTKSE